MPLPTRPILRTFVLILLGAFLAGCLGDDGAMLADNGNDDATDPETGRVEGRVLTEDLDPVNGARVSLVDGSELIEVVVTDASGNYLIDGVPPGDYRLQTSAACCREDATRVLVEAGETTSIDLMLARFTAADLRVPHVIEKDWSGFISCGVAVDGVVGAALCSILEDPSEDFLREFEVPEGIKTLSVGMTWDSVGGVSGQEFALLIENDDCDVVDCSYSYAEPEGPPELVVNIHNDDITEEEWKWDTIDGTRGLQFRVFTGGTGIVYQQPFTIYFHMHMYEEAPADYSPIPDF
jgi:hypothetical protein